LTAFIIKCVAQGKRPLFPGDDTISGGIIAKLKERVTDFQPVNANFSLVHIDKGRRRKSEAKEFVVQKALENFKNYLASLEEAGILSVSKK